MNDTTMMSSATANKLCEYKRDHMSQMHTVATWTTASIKEERLPLFVAIQNPIELTAYLGLGTSIGGQNEEVCTDGRRRRRDGGKRVVCGP